MEPINKIRTWYDNRGICVDVIKNKILSEPTLFLGCGTFFKYHFFHYLMNTLCFKRLYVFVFVFF